MDYQPDITLKCRHENRKGIFFRAKRRRFAKLTARRVINNSIHLNLQSPKSIKKRLHAKFKCRQKLYSNLSQRNTN